MAARRHGPLAKYRSKRYRTRGNPVQLRCDALALLLRSLTWRNLISIYSVYRSESALHLDSSVYLNRIGTRGVPGATGYLVKDTPPAVLLDAIKEVHHGGSPMSMAIARRVVSSFKKKPDSPLTARETEILQKLCDGDNHRVIAETLFISSDTVRAHIKNIYRKLHVHSRAEVVKKAIENRLI